MKRVKEAYYKDRDMPESPLASGLLKEPVEAEIYNDEDGNSVYIEPVYTIPEAAIALAKNPLTLKRWIKVGMVPAPAFRDSTHNYLRYLETEVQAIADALNEHHREYQYFREDHLETIRRIHAQVEQARRNLE